MEVVGDYWDDDTIEKVTHLLLQYQDLFPNTFEEMKEIFQGVRRNEDSIKTQCHAYEAITLSIKSHL